MITTCFWCLCLLLQGITFCGSCNVGTRSEMMISAQNLTTQSGELFMAECIKQGENPVINWSLKKGLFPNNAIHK